MPKKKHKPTNWFDAIIGEINNYKKKIKNPIEVKKIKRRLKGRKK